MTQQNNLKNGEKTPFREVRFEAKAVTALQKIAVSRVIKKQKAPGKGTLQVRSQPDTFQPLFYNRLLAFFGLFGKNSFGRFFDASS